MRRNEPIVPNRFPRLGMLSFVGLSSAAMAQPSLELIAWVGGPAPNQCTFSTIDSKSIQLNKFGDIAFEGFSLDISGEPIGMSFVCTRGFLFQYLGYKINSGECSDSNLECADACFDDPDVRQRYDSGFTDFRLSDLRTPGTFPSGEYPYAGGLVSSYTVEAGVPGTCGKDTAALLGAPDIGEWLGFGGKQTGLEEFHALNAGQAAYVLGSQYGICEEGVYLGSVLHCIGEDTPIPGAFYDNFATVGVSLALEQCVGTDPTPVFCWGSVLRGASSSNDFAFFKDSFFCPAEVVVRKGQQAQGFPSGWTWLPPGAGDGWISINNPLVLDGAGPRYAFKSTVVDVLQTHYYTALYCGSFGNTNLVARTGGVAPIPYSEATATFGTGNFHVSPRMMLSNRNTVVFEAEIDVVYPNESTVLSGIWTASDMGVQQLVALRDEPIVLTIGTQQKSGHFTNFYDWPAIENHDNIAFHAQAEYSDGTGVHEVDGIWFGTRGRLMLVIAVGDTLPNGDLVDQLFFYPESSGNDGARRWLNDQGQLCVFYQTFDHVGILLASDLPVHCPSDVNGDGFVTGDDYDAFLACFESGQLCGDYDGDGFVTGDDFDKFIADYVLGC